MPRFLFVLAILISPGLPAGAQPPDADTSAGTSENAAELPPTVAEHLPDFAPEDGLLRTYRDARRGRIWLELPPPSGPRGLVTSVLYVEGLTTGLGSNPVGLDRGQLGDSRIFDIRRLGNRVLFEQRNLGFRADSEDGLEQRATRQSFATTVEWAAQIAALDADGTSVVDLTPFLVRDAHAVESTLRATGQGAYKLDPERSAVDFEACLSFPDNLELEAFLTYSLDGEDAGQQVASTAPAGNAFTLVQHHSLIRLPDDGYRGRRGDPRIGFYGPQYLDYAADLGDSIDRWLIARHRLEKADPSAERSPAVEPIVYYVDPGAPEPIRGALLDGARWWAKAFEAAGFIDAFRVEVLPADAHPLDIRYNVIQWVHRSTRGWSYGGGVIDPRSGEILKGHVSLGSLRVRQDRLLFEGLLGTAKTGTGEADDPIQLALARIRQLSAHEVGHTLGLTHNFAASTYGRASVMDYPAPWVDFTEGGELDVSRVYGVGVGAWDVHSIRYGYSQFEPATEDRELEAIVGQGVEQGLVFLSDSDARPAAAAEPRASLWDNGEDAVESLELSLRVRRHALDRFGEHNLRPGQPMARLEEVLAPVYFHHRFQLEAAVKTLGGLHYDYGLRGDGQAPPRMIGGEAQRRALGTILKLLRPETLDIPESVLDLLAPRPFGSSPNREMFATSTWPAFDAIGAAESAADHALVHVLQPERLSRLIDFARRDPGLPSAAEVLDAVIEQAFEVEVGMPARQRVLSQSVQRVAAERLMALAADAAVPERLRWLVEDRLGKLALELLESDAHGRALARRIERLLTRSHEPGASLVAAASLPPGSPIGQADPSFSWRPRREQSRAAEGCSWQPPGRARGQDAW